MVSVRVAVCIDLEKGWQLGLRIEVGVIFRTEL